MELWLTATEREKLQMDASVLIEIEDLRKMKVGALRIKYREVFGEESRSSNKQFLFRRIAWRLRANVEGTLSERARRRASDLADDADLRIRAPDGFFGEPGGGLAGNALDRAGREETDGFPPRARCSRDSLKIGGSSLRFSKTALSTNRSDIVL
jgi:hypothetical protein